MIDTSLGEADYYASSDYIGVGRRLVVVWIDSLVLILIGMVLWMPFTVLLLTGVLRSDPSSVYVIAYAATVWVYLAPIKRSNFGTLGYRLLGIRLVSAKGGRPSLLNMTLRMVMWTYGPFNWVLNLLWLGADSEFQSLRDCYLGTYMIKRDAKPIGRGPAHLTRYTAMCFVLVYPRVCRPKPSA